MIDYIKLYYPEDFNDYIESSEFIALIDLIAFMGQSLAFRTDLNARENFIDTAQRRDSILKLARLVSYNPKRNSCSYGYLKIDSVTTSETVYDSNGINLAGYIIRWADSANENWFEQFTSVLNASFQSGQLFGKPANRQVLNSIQTDEYQVNLVTGQLAVFSVSKTVNGSTLNFEIVSPSSAGQPYIYEVAPKLNKPLNLLYKNDGLGNNSINTGFFAYFKQGSMGSTDFNLAESLPNRVYTVGTKNINNTDVWLYSLDVNGNPDVMWEVVPSVGVTNVIYNQSVNKNIYQINSTAGDAIDLVFGDGSFANIPQGNYRLYYRVSDGSSYKITPDDMKAISIPVNYTSAAGRTETITLTASLHYTVANATATETIDNIRQKAPQQYYTQNRMINGEDYNIMPYTLFNDVLKVKAVGRTSSGVSRYLDVIDTTGKYSSTNIFAQDGYLYRDTTLDSFTFEFNTTTDIYKVIYDQVNPIVTSKDTQQFFYALYPTYSVEGFLWNRNTVITNGCTGYFQDGNLVKQQIGSTGTSDAQRIIPGSIVRFNAGNGNYFNAQNVIKAGVPSQSGDKLYIYATVQDVVGNGTIVTSGIGPVTITQVIPNNAVVDKIYAVYNTNFTPQLVAQMSSYIQTYQSFGLRYDSAAGMWTIIIPQNFNTTSEFSLANAGDTTNGGLDSSWIIAFTAADHVYTVSYRGIKYVFGSVAETDFYYDDSFKLYDPVTGMAVGDKIKVLKGNNIPDSYAPLGLDYEWSIYKPITAVDGYVDPNNVVVTFSDFDSDGVPDNPELFEILVRPETNTTSKFIYFKEAVGYDSFIDYTLIDANTVVSSYVDYSDINAHATLYVTGQLFYATNTNLFYQLTVTNGVYNVSQVSGYVSKVGRQDIYFQYRHSAPNYRRIDPSPSNIIDLYMLTQTYSDDYVSWIQDTTGTVAKPVAPTSDDLSTNYSTLEKYKSISDTIVYNSAKFKPIFGKNSESALQATFKVVKNPSIVISDNDIKTSVINAINTYFDVANWDFGETFYFSELSAYLHAKLTPNVASIIIVPVNQSSGYGSLQQINADYNEIIISSATVDNVTIISAITAAAIGQVKAA